MGVLMWKHLIRYYSMEKGGKGGQQILNKTNVYIAKITPAITDKLTIIEFLR